MKKMTLIISLFFALGLKAQGDDTMHVYHHKVIEVVNKEFIKQYNYLKPRVVKVYPYALYAADALDQIENDVESIKRRRKRNKHYRLSYKALKESFKYAMLDLYISEGQILMKLIGRETGMTVHQIVKKYRGIKDAMVFNLMGKMFEQNIKEKYVKKDNYVLEYIIREIELGKIKLTDPKIITKKDFKAENDRIKANKKKRKKINKLRKKQLKIDNKNKRKALKK